MTDSSEHTQSYQRSAFCLLLSVALIIAIVPAPVFAQEGTSIPGSGTAGGTTQAGSTPGATETTTQSGGKDKCGGFFDCWNSMRTHTQNAAISAAQGVGNWLNPVNPQGGKKEGKEIQEQLGKAKEDGKEALGEIPGPWGAFMNWVKNFVSSFINFALDVIDGILWSLFALPAPGQAFDPGTWYPTGTTPLNNSSNISNASVAVNNSSNATENVTAIQPMVEGGGIDRSVLPAGLDFDAWWNTIWKMYAGVAGLVAFLLFATGVFTLSSKSYTPRERNQRLRDLVISATLVLFGPIIIPMILHFGNIVTAGLTPSASELFNSFGDLLKMRNTVGLAALGVYISSSIMATGFAIAAITAFAQWILTFFLSATWILWAPLYGTQNKTLKAWSRMGFASLGFLVALKILQAFLFRFLWMLPIKWSQPAESIITLILFPIGLVFIFYYLPKQGLDKAIPSFVSTVGSGGGSSFTYDNSTNRNFVHNIGDRTNNPDPSGDGPDDPSNNGSSGSSGGGDSGGGDSGGGSSGGSSLSILNPFSSGEGENGGSNGRSRVRNWSPDFLFGGGGASSIREGTNTPDGSSQAVLNSADHDNRDGQGVTEAEAEDARTRVGSRDEEIRPEMAEAIAGEGDNLSPEEANEGPAESEIEGPEDIGEGNEMTESSEPFDGEIPPDIREQIEGPENIGESNGMPESGEPFDGEIPPEIQEQIEGPENIGEGNEMPESGEPFDGEIPPEIQEQIEEPESTDIPSDGNNEGTTNEEMPDEYQELIEETEPPDGVIPENGDSEGRTRDRNLDPDSDGDGDDNSDGNETN